MSAIRARFTRGHEVKFISHLDLMKVFERAIRRSGLPIEYSQGFNPHPQMVFGLPLPVGVTSDAEYADFELSGDIGASEFSRRLNQELPKGINITDARLKTAKGNIMASITAALQDIDIFVKDPVSLDDANARLQTFLNSERISVEKEIKGGKRGKDVIKTVDIRPLVKSLDINPLDVIPPGYEEFSSAFRMTALLSAGSASNLKPELFMNAFGSVTGLDIATYLVHRRELYVDNGGKLADPLDEAVLIEGMR